MYKIDNTNTFSVSEVSQPEFLMIESGICTQVFLNERLSPNGNPYFVGIAVDEISTKSTKFLIDKRDYSSVQSFNLIGQRINFDIRSNGLKIKRLDLQPKETIKFIKNLISNESCELKEEELNQAKFEKSSDVYNTDKNEADLKSSKSFIEDLVVTVTQRSHDLGMPMFIGVCIPEEKK